MGLFGLFKKKSDETKVGNVEDFISLTRVYFQSVIATNLGITNIRFLPDVANFKRLFKVPTQNGKLDWPKNLLRAKCCCRIMG